MGKIAVLLVENVWIAQHVTIYITGSCDQGCDPGFEGLTCKKGTSFIKMPLNWDFFCDL